MHTTSTSCWQVAAPLTFQEFRDSETRDTPFTRGACDVQLPDTTRVLFNTYAMQQLREVPVPPFKIGEVVSKMH